MISYRRTWCSSRNAVGFAAECARLALSFYDGHGRQVLVAAIEIAERFARGRNIVSHVARAAACGAYVVPTRIAKAAAYAAFAAADASSSVSAANATYAAHAAINTWRVHDVLRVFARWVAKDLGIKLSTAQQRNAAVAALAAGNEEVLFAIGEAA